MAKLQTITMQDLAKEVAEKALQGVTLNGLPLQDFIKMVNDAYERNECHLASCRYNRNSICQNEDKRKECVDVSKLVLCLEDKENE